MSSPVSRRTFLGGVAATLAAPTLRGAGLPAPIPRARPQEGMHAGRIFKAVKIGMIKGELPFEEKFSMLRELGFDGVEMDSPTNDDLERALAASRKTGLPIHGVVDSIHWRVRLSDPDPAMREEGLQGLLTAIQDSHFLGGSSVLLVPGRVADLETENQQHVWDRSIEEIRKALPTAARFGIRILIENVWNGFCYIHDGPPDQTADQLAAYIDEIDSPWVGVYFDIGNHRKYGRPEEWIRTLGTRIVKLDVKGWGEQASFCKIGDGDVDWPAVQQALHEIGFTGWATAEVSGGDRERLQEVAERMDIALGLGG